MTTPPTPVERALALLREGRVVDADDLMTRELHAVTARHGHGSPEWASAVCDLGNVLLNTDQLDRAIGCYREAVSAPAHDHQSRKDQLTYRLNLGLALRMAGRLDEAEAELRRGAQERLAFYGRQHAGYAFGLEPLASLLLRRGDVRQARVVVDEAVDNLRQNRHERVAAALALRAAMASLGLAIAQSEAEEAEAALRTYASADARAERIGRADLRSQVLRNWGLALREAGRPGPAEQRLAEAMTQARRSGDHETVGRAGVALGLFLQHEGRLPEARAVLEEGLAVLDPVHPDAIVGRSHLGAVNDGRTCGCGDLRGTIAAAFREFVITRLPADLLARLDVTIADGDFQISVELRREPTEAELERLNGVFRSAQAEFRRRLGARDAA